MQRALGYGHLWSLAACPVVCAFIQSVHQATGWILAAADVFAPYIAENRIVILAGINFHFAKEATPASSFLFAEPLSGCRFSFGLGCEGSFKGSVENILG